MPPLPEYLSGFPPPRPPAKPTNIPQESDEIVYFLGVTWPVLLKTMAALLVLIAFLVVLLRCCISYDRYQTARAEDLSTREDSLVRACEQRGRVVAKRMGKERMKRIGRNMDKRQAEHLRRRSTLQGKLPVLGMMGRAPVPGVGEGPALEASLGRKKSRREERRGAGTQMLSEEEDTLRKRMVFTLPRGAEGRIGNSIWRSSSGQTIRRTNSQPTVFYGAGSFRQLTRSVPARSSGFCNSSNENGHLNTYNDQASKATTTVVADMLVEAQIPLLRRSSFDIREEELLDVPEAPKGDASGGTSETSYNTAIAPQSPYERIPFLGRLSFGVDTEDLFDIARSVERETSPGTSQTSYATAVAP